MTIPDEILNPFSDIACCVVGSQLYRQANENSDIDLKIICLDDIYNLLPVRDKSITRTRIGKYEITRITLTDIINGLKIGKINEVEIVTSDLIPYNPKLVLTLRDLFIRNMNDTQKLNLINNCIGVINSCKSRQEKERKPISVLGKVNHIYRKAINPLDRYQFPNIDEALTTLLTTKHSVTTRMNLYKPTNDKDQKEILELNKWKYTSLYLEIQKEQYGTIVKKII